MRRLDVVALSHSDADHAGGLARHPPSLHGGRVLGKRIVATGRRGDAAGPRALARAAARAPRRQPTLAGRGAGDGPQPRRWSPDRRQRRVPGAQAGLARRLAAPHGRPRMGGRRAHAEPVRAAARHRCSRWAITAAASRRARPSSTRRAPPSPIVSAGARNPFRHPAPETLGAPRGGRRPRLPHRPRRRHHRRDRRRPALGDALGARNQGRLRSGSRASRRWGSERRGHRGRPTHHGLQRGSRRPWWDARRAGGARRRACARSARAAAPAPRDRGACPGRAPSLPGWS